MITDEEKKPKVLSTDELLKRFNAQKAGTPGAINEDLDPWGTEPVDIDTMLSGKPQTPKVPEAKPIQQDTTRPTAEFDGTLDWKDIKKSKKEYEKEPRLSPKEYFQGLGNKVKSSVMGLGEMVMEIPQGIESLSNAPAVMLTEAMINRKLRRGEIDQESAEVLMKEAKAMTPRRTVTGNMAFTDTMPGELLAEGDVNKWFEANKVKFSEMGDKYDKTATQYLKSGQFGKALGAVSYGIAESLAPTIAAAVIPGGAAALGVGVGSTQYDEVKDREDMAEGMKMADAVTVGMFEWLFERFGSREMGKALMDIYQKSGKEGVVKAFTSPATKNLIAKAYKKFGVWFAPVHEGISEGLTTLGQNAAAILSGEDPERKIQDGFWDSVLIGAGMGGMFSLTEKTAEKYRVAREGKAGPITGPLTIEDQDPEVMIRDLGKKYAYNGFNSELPDQNFIKYGEMKDGRKVIIKSTNFATDPANMLVAVVDAENPESKPQMVKGNMINNSMDVPYEQWVQNEMRNYQATMSQISNEAAKATAPVQEGATIPIGEQLFNVTQVTDQGIVLNEIDKEGNLTANAQTITPDKYGEVFGMPVEEAPQAQAQNPVAQVAQTAQTPVETTQQPLAQTAQVAQTTTVSPQSRKVSDGKNEFTIIPQEDGNFRMSESFETQKEAETALKKLQERYPKLTWKAEMTDSEDLFTPDTYTIVAEPKKKPAAPVAEAPKAELQKPAEAPVVAPEVKAEAVQPVSQTPSTPDETAAEEEVQNAGEVETQVSKGIPTYAQKKQIVLDHFGGMYEDAAASTPEQIYEQVPEVTPEEAKQIHAEIKSEFEAEQEKTRNTPDPLVSIAKAEGQVDLRPTEEQKKAGTGKAVIDKKRNVYVPAGAHGTLLGDAPYKKDLTSEYPELTRITDETISQASPLEMWYLVQMSHPTENGFTVSRGAMLTEWSRRGKEIFEALGFPVELDYPYKHTSDSYRQKYGGVMPLSDELAAIGSRRAESPSYTNWWAAAERTLPIVDFEKEIKRLQQGIKDLKAEYEGLNAKQKKEFNLDYYVQHHQGGIEILKAYKPGGPTGVNAEKKVQPAKTAPAKKSNPTTSQKSAEDTRPVKKLKEKKGWPMSKADEARLSREPQSFEEAVYQFFIGRGRISTASLKHHLGTRSREDYSSYIWAHKKDGQKTDKLNEAYIFQAHPELLKQTGDQQDQERAFMDILLSVHGLNDMRTRIDEMQRKADEVNAEPAAPESEEEIDYIDAGQVVDEEILPLEEEDPEILRIFELEINELGKALDDLKNLAANDPDYFQVFPYGLNEKQFNELKSILNDTERQKQIIGLDHEVNQSESRSQGDNEVPGSIGPESRTDGEGREEGGTEESFGEFPIYEREIHAIEEWLPDSEHSDYISYEWDGQTLEIFKGRDERIIELSRDQLIDEGVKFPEVIAPALSRPEFAGEFFEQPQLTFEEKISKATELGAAAFAKGAKRVPAQDKDLVELTSGVPVGKATPILEAWIKAWDKANLAKPIGVEPVKAIWQMTKQDFAYSPLRYDAMPTTDGSGIFRAEENADGTWNAWVEFPDGKRDYWTSNGSAGEAWDGGKRKTAYMNQEADTKSLDRHRDAVIQALNEGQPVPEEVLRNYIGLKDYLEKQKKKEAAKPREKESPIPAKYREQVDNLKALVNKESEGLDANRRIAEINAIESPTKAQIKERNQLRLILENTREEIARRNDRVDYDIIPENKAREIRKLIEEARAQDEAIGQRILRLQDERDAKEKSLQKRAGLFGDRKEEEERKSGMQPMFAGEIFEASSENLQSALKPFNDAIKKAEEEWKRNAQMLDEKIALVLSGAQTEIKMEPASPEAPAKSSIEKYNGKTFIDKDGNYKSIVVKVVPDQTGAYLTLTDQKGIVTPRPMWINAKDLFQNIESGYFRERKEDEPAEKPKEPSNYGQSNTVFTEDAAAKAREILRKKLGNLSVGIDPETMQAGITLAGYHIEAGARKFADYAKAMITDLGEAIKPYLKSFYNAVRDWPGFDPQGMDDYGTVSSADIDKIVAESIANSNKISNLDKGNNTEGDVHDRSGNSQPNSSDNTDEISGDEESLPNEGGGSGSVGDESQGRGRQESRRGGRTGGSGLFTPLFGESGDNEVHPEEQSPEPADDDAGDFDGRGNGLFGPAGSDLFDQGTDTESDTDSERVSTSFQEKTRLRKIAQRKAEPIPVKFRDEENIRATLPVLLPEQQDDVIKAENRFFGEQHQTREMAYGKGMLFTNGTGTGKTFTGLGIIKRFAKSGKKNILIVVPSEAKKKDWISDGENLMLSITELKDTKDMGKGIRVTTYAAFRANDNLKNVDFDLIVYDESHRLMEEKSGNASATTQAHYELANIDPDYAFRRLSSVHPLWIKAKQLNELIRKDSISSNNLDLMDWQYAEIHDRIKANEQEYEKVEEEKRKVEPSLRERAQKAYQNTKVVYLSATPFKGHFNLRYANKTLFDWGDETTYEQASRGMSRVDPESRFFLDNFGSAYEWKYHRLQSKSKANAEAIAMQEVAFAEKLMSQGVMSGRAIESDMDYSREFPLVALDKTEIFNKAFTDIFTYGEAATYPKLTGAASEVFFNYNYTTQLLESLRATMTIPRIEKHLSMGRKVVVFHRRKQANVTPPFANILQVARNTANTVLGDKYRSEREKEGARETLRQADLFEDNHRELLEYEQTLTYSPATDQILAKFGQDRVGFINGDISKREKVDNIRRFNDDDSGLDVIVVQEEAGKEGISLHDTTGKHQRVMMSLSLPISSTTALQMEGRIYRIGQETDAIFENPILGLDMEIADFGQKINRKLSTTENLAIGNQARDLIRSFAEGVIFNAKKDDPNTDQGKGGKEYDKKAQKELNEFRRAVLVYNSNQKNRGRRDQREGTDYFATPEPLGQKMVEWLDLKPGDSALEPSAGHGAIAMWFPESVSSTSIEPSYSLFAKLNARAGGGNRKVVRSTFEDFSIVNKFNGIAMNPPFGAGGKLAIEHLEKAFGHLRNGGRIVAIIPDGPSMEKRFDNFLYGTDEDGKYLHPDAHLTATIKLPRITFEQAGTSVASRVVVVDKIEKRTLESIKKDLRAENLERLMNGGIMMSQEEIETEAQRRLKQQEEMDVPYERNIELNDAKTVDEFFDEIENISIAPRVVLTQQASSPLTAAEPAEKAGGFAQILEQKHSKTGAKLYTVHLTERVSSEVFNKYRDSAKAMGGSWSSYAKEGIKPGFMFNTLADATKFHASITGGNEGGKGAMFRTSNQVYYSPIEKALEAIKQNKATAKQWKAMLLNNGAKQAELDWMGWDDFAMIFGDTSDMERKHVQTWIDQNRVGIKDITLDDTKETSKLRSLELKAEAGRRTIDEIQEEIGFRPYRVAVTGEWVYRDDDSEIQNVPEEYIDDLDKADEAIQALHEFDEEHIDITGDYNLRGTKYGKYVLPGGDNYKELLLTMPGQRVRQTLGWEQTSDIAWALKGSADIYIIKGGNGDYNLTIDGDDVSWHDTLDEAKQEAEKRFLAGKLGTTEGEFKSSHWDEPNILAHVRFDTKTTEAGKNILFIEEIQSDWAQKGKKEGFGEPESVRKAREELDQAQRESVEIEKQLNAVVKEMHDKGLPSSPSSTELNWFEYANDNFLKSVNPEYRKLSQTQLEVRNNRDYDAIQKRLDEISREYRSLGLKRLELIAKRNKIDLRIPLLKAEVKTIKGIPDMPFKKTDQWAGLAIRRMIKYAIDEGFDAIAWTTGEQQAERYDLSKVVESVIASYGTGRTSWKYKLFVTYNDGNNITEYANTPEELESYVGKELADKIVNEVNGYGSNKTYAGLDLKVGGSGMKAFYDEILPSIANKIGKKYNAKVGEEILPEEYHYYVLEDKEKGTFSIYSGNSDLVEDGWASQKDAFARVEQLRVKNGAQVHSLPITDSMFNAFREGVPMFRRAEVPKPQYETGYDALARYLEQDEADDQRHETKVKVESLGQELNTPVRAINNRNELPPKVQAQAKRIGVWENETMYGAWDEQTGTMFVLLDDLMKLGPQRAIEEGIRTVLHEAVAHKGLPILLGDRGYDNLVNEIYDSIPDDDLTLIRYQYGWTEDKKLIAEEYLGMMAEDNVNPSLFQRIIAKIRQLLRKYFKVAYSKNDVYTLLRASRKNLETAPEEERGFYRSRPQPENFEYAGEFVQAQGTYFRTRKAAASKRNTTLGKAAEAYMEKAAKRTGEETVQGIREYIQDLSLPIRRFEEELLRRGGKQDNTSKPYRDMSLSFGRQEKLYNDYFEGKMKPILQAVADIKRAGIPGEDILPYIIAKHAMERNPAFRSRELKEWVESHKENVPQDEVNAKMEELKDKDYSGVMGFDTDKTYTNPDQLARDIVSEFEGQVDAKLITNLWNKIGAATTEILDTWQRGHQITPDQKQEYLSQFRYFVPLRGWREGAAKELVYTKGEGFSRSLQYAKGRKSLADNPLAYLLNVQFQAIAEQVDNEVKTSMVNLIIKNLSNNEMHEMATIKKLYYVKITLPDGTEEWEPTIARPPQEMFDSGDAKTKVYSEHERLRKPRQAREHEVYVRKPGGDMVMVFNGKYLSTAQAMNKQNYMYRTIFGNIYDARDINKVMALMGHMNNMLKGLYTSWNVVFPFTNFMRDFQEASITQQIKTKTGGKVIKNYRAAFPAIIRRIQGKQDLRNPMDSALEDFYNYGGATGYTHSKTPEEIEKDINKEIARMVRKGTIAGGIGNVGHSLLDAIAHWNKIFEDATRFSVYLSSLAIGNTKEDAAMDAKEASVNFNRKGKGSKAWDAWFAFFNVAVQSMQKNFKLAKDTPKRFTQIAFSFVMLGFLEALMNALTDDEDDPDSSYYNLNPYMRQNYLVIPLPKIGDLRKKSNKYLSVPLPQFWRGFKSIGSIAFDVATGRMKAGEAVTTAMGNFAGGLLPVDIGGFYKSGEFSIAPLVPTITKPVVELIENRNYMGYTIKKEPFTREQKKYLANAGLGKDNVNPAAKFFTDLLFRWSGGDSRYKYYTDKQGRTRKVLLDVNPSTVEHLFKGYTGGTGGVFSDILTTVSQAFDKEEEVDFRNVPFVDRFIRKTPEAKWSIISEYYDLKEDDDRDVALMKEYEKKGRETGDVSQYSRMATDEYRVMRRQLFDTYEDRISDLTKTATKDDMETADLVIEMMDRCIGQVKELEARYRRKY